MDEEYRIRFKGGAKAFVRTYDFLGSILPYSSSAWEKLSIFLNLLAPKLPVPAGQDLSEGILSKVGMESYRAEKRAAAKISLPDEDGEIGPVPAASTGAKPELEAEKLSSIIKMFNDLFGNIPWSDKDRIGRVISDEIPRRVSSDSRYMNAQRNSDKENARVEHDRALDEAIHERMGDEAELFAKFFQDDMFKAWLRSVVFEETYRPGSAA